MPFSSSFFLLFLWGRVLVTPSRGRPFPLAGPPARPQTREVRTDRAGGPRRSEARQGTTHPTVQRNQRQQQRRMQPPPTRRFPPSLFSPIQTTSGAAVNSGKAIARIIARPRGNGRRHRTRSPIAGERDANDRLLARRQRSPASCASTPRRTLPVLGISPQRTLESDAHCAPTSNRRE